MTPGSVVTGRQVKRTRTGYCLGCEARIKVGAPRPTTSWPARLKMDEETHSLLLVAAAEYLELCAEAGYPPDVVEFLDWVFPPVGTGSVLAGERLEGAA